MIMLRSTLRFSKSQSHTCVPGTRAHTFKVQISDPASTLKLCVICNLKLQENVTRIIAQAFTKCASMVYCILQYLWWHIPSKNPNEIRKNHATFVFRSRLASKNSLCSPEPRRADAAEPLFAVSRWGISAVVPAKPICSWSVM